jgi:hypothetical protein
MGKKWACRTYYNPNPFISFSWHDTIMMVPVPPFVVPTKAFHLNFSVVQGLWIGSFLSNGRGKKVVGDDLLFVGRTSDAGLFIPHISFPPNWMNIMTTLFGSSMCLFGCSSVTLACKNAIWGNEDCDLAATPFGSVPLSLNLACHDPYSFPTDIVVVWGSVYSGMSLADLLAALIDFAINLGCEVLMKYVGQPLAMAGASKLKKGVVAAANGVGNAWTKVVKKFGKTATTGTKAAAKGAAQQGIFAKLTSAFNRFAGYQATEATKTYTTKAATARGMYNSLKEMCYSTGKNLDSDLVDLVKQGTPGVFSKEFLSQLQNINSKKYDDYVTEMMPKMKKSLGEAEASGSKLAKEAYDDKFIADKVDDLVDPDIQIIKYNELMTDSVAFDSTVRSDFFNVMKALNTAAEDAVSTELARSLGYAAVKKSFSQILWKHSIRNGGLISFNETYFGYTFDYDSSVNRQFSEKWWANQEWFGYELWDAGDLGLTETDDSAYWEESYVEGDGSDDDYWFYTVADDSSSSSSDNSSSGSDDSSDDDDDYWYDADNNADAAE